MMPVDARARNQPGPRGTQVDRRHLIVTFLALLELVREQLVAIAQAEPYAPIHVQLTGRPGFALAS